MVFNNDKLNERKIEREDVGGDGCGDEKEGNYYSDQEDYDAEDDNNDDDEDDHDNEDDNEKEEK